MQTIPAVVNGYNKTVSKPALRATFEDISGNDERAARIQIRIGCYFLGAANAWLHKNYPESAPSASLSTAEMDQIRLALTAYAIGPGNVREKFEILEQQGKPLTFAQLKKSFPTWGQIKAGPNKGKWSNRPLLYGQKVGDNYEKHDRHNNRPGKIEQLTARATQYAKSPGGFFIGALRVGGMVYGGKKLYSKYKVKK
jgi:hypothetical protein